MFFHSISLLISLFSNFFPEKESGINFFHNFFFSVCFGVFWLDGWGFFVVFVCFKKKKKQLSITYGKRACILDLEKWRGASGHG